MANIIETREELQYLMQFHNIDKVLLLDDRNNYLGYIDINMGYHPAKFKRYREDVFAVNAAMSQFYDYQKMLEQMNNTKKVSVEVVEYVENDTWVYADEDGVERHHVYPKKIRKEHLHVLEGTLPEVFMKFEKMQNHLRYCNGHGYKFKNSGDDRLHTIWYENLSESKRLDLYYGNGIVN